MATLSTYTKDQIRKVVFTSTQEGGGGGGGGQGGGSGGSGGGGGGGQGGGQKGQQPDVKTIDLDKKPKPPQKGQDEGGDKGGEEGGDKGGEKGGKDGGKQKDLNVGDFVRLRKNGEYAIITDKRDMGNGQYDYSWRYATPEEINANVSSGGYEE